ncbi:MAG: winged helix-turn-helix transcriptional regulator [Deltaproteobacteria bacterium]|nr:winged helix-turn-helix transcriptional regulator [Deltaproteobacteria bacterium]
MNNKDEQADDYRSLLLLDEISKNDELTQRDLSKNLGVALGLINSYIKNLASRGFITVSAIPKKRYKYYLTPTGFAEKTRLTYQHLQNFTNLYRVARRDFHTLFQNVRSSMIKKIVFCGVDEVTEIAFLSLKEAELELAGIIDKYPSKKKFFGHDVLSIEGIKDIDYDIVVITCFQGGGQLREGLLSAGVAGHKIYDISVEGWLKKIEHHP